MVASKRTPEEHPALGQTQEQVRVQQCPECGSTRLMRDYEKADIICMDCGFVLKARIASRRKAASFFISKKTESKFERLDSKEELFGLCLDLKTLDKMASGTCILPSNQESHDDIVIVCKDGKSVKIFELAVEKRRHVKENP